MPINLAIACKASNRRIHIVTFDFVKIAETERNLLEIVRTIFFLPWIPVKFSTRKVVERAFITFFSELVFPSFLKFNF